MAGLNYIPQGVEDIYSKYADYYQKQGQQDISRNALVSGRRTSDMAPEAISKFNTEYGLGQSMGMANLSVAGANQAQQEALMWGGLSPYTGNTIQGQNPYATSERKAGQEWSAGQSAIEREFQKSQAEASYLAQKTNAEQAAGANIWAGIAGGFGSLLGGIFGRGI